jgi:hypothetical protein
MTHMVRTQVQLTEEQLRLLRQLSAVTGRSIADLVRQSLALYLAQHQRSSREELVARALRLVGKFSSNRSDISVEHDRYLNEAFRD